MKLLLLSLMVLLGNNMIAQNLVPNWSFEDTLQCPTNTGQLSYAIGWINPTATSPDLWNDCMTVLPYQQPRTGHSYAGIGMDFPNSASSIREYIEIQLSDSLIAGTKYCITFYVSCVDGAATACNDIGAFFSSNQVNSATVNALSFIPQISNPSSNTLTDTLSWLPVTGSFMAAGGENFLTIGFFKDDLNIDTVHVKSTNFTRGCYYFIDDVIVEECRDTLTEVNIPNVFTPNGDGINDLFKIETGGTSTLECTIYNRWGIKIAEVNSSTGYVWDGRTTSGIDAVQGVYYYIMNAKGVDGQDYQQKGFVHLLR